MKVLRGRKKVLAVTLATALVLNAVPSYAEVAKKMERVPAVSVTDEGIEEFFMDPMTEKIVMSARDDAMGRTKQSEKIEEAIKKSNDMVGKITFNEPVEKYAEILELVGIEYINPEAKKILKLNNEGKLGYFETMEKMKKFTPSDRKFSDELVEGMINLEVDLYAEVFDISKMEKEKLDFLGDFMDRTLEIHDDTLTNAYKIKNREEFDRNVFELDATHVQDWNLHLNANFWAGKYSGDMSKKNYSTYYTLEAMEKPIPTESIFDTEMGSCLYPGMAMFPILEYNAELNCTMLSYGYQG